MDPQRSVYTNPWQVDLQIVELEQFSFLESEMCSRRNHDSIVEMVDQHPVLAPLCYVETLVFYQKVMTKRCEELKKMATLNTHSVTHAGFKRFDDSCKKSMKLSAASFLL